ncbi:hypothetical protein ES703_77240 [subsurface metagenome]
MIIKTLKEKMLSVTPAQAGVQKKIKRVDSRFRGNDTNSWFNLGNSLKIGGK